MQNLATAVTALETFEDATGLSIGDDAFKNGLEAVEWPGRFQILREDPLVIVDGAHNPPAALALRDSLKSLRTGKPIAIVAGFCDDKDSVAVLKTLRPVFKKAFPTEIPSPRSLAVGECTERFKIAGYADVTPSANWREALDNATEWARENAGAVVVCGSLFLVGAILGQGPIFPNESLRRTIC